MSKKKSEQKNKALTARQRKELNRPQAEEVRENSDAASFAARKKKRNGILIIAAVALTVIIAIGIIVPVWYNSDYRYEDNPVVEIKLGNGMTLRYEVYIADACNVGTNFLFLCDVGYYNDSIIYDTQNNWARFGGYYVGENDSYAHRSADSEFLKKTADYFDDHAGTNQFRYKLIKDEKVKFTQNDTAAKYGLFGNYNNFCTEFEVLGQAGADVKLGTITYNVEYIASAYDDETKNNIDAIFALGTGDTTYKSVFKTCEPFISIKETKVFNYSRPYVGKFEKYMTESNAISTSWTGSYPAK